MSSSLSVPSISVVGLTLAIAFVLLASNIAVIYAQVPLQQQVQSDGGGLTAALNGANFARGDTITVSGTVADRDPNSNVLIRVVDPQSNEVEVGVVDVTADNTFTYSFVAGEQEEFDSDDPMTISGNYRMIVSYITPAFDNEAVELTFAYNTFPQTQSESVITASPSPPIDSRITTTEGAAITTPVPAATTFQSTNDSFRVQVPHGWIIHDVNNTGSSLLEESRLGYGMLAQLCPEEEIQSTVPTVNSSGNTSDCVASQDEVLHVIRYPDLLTRIQPSNNITAYHLQKLEEVGYRTIQVINSSDMTVNLTNHETNETVRLLPAKFAEVSYTTASAPNEVRNGYFILTFTNATTPNQGTAKGYSVFYEGNTSSAAIPGITRTSATSSGLLAPTPLPPTAKQILDSFELLVAPPPPRPGGAGAVGGQTQGGSATTGGGDLNCEDIAERNFPINPNNDPNGFDADNDGIGCETGASGEVIEPETGNGGNVGEDDDSNGEDSSCHPSYPDNCISPPPPNLNCDDVGSTNFRVVGSDPHGFDADNDGIGCESGSSVPDDDDGEGEEEPPDDNPPDDNPPDEEPEPDPEPEPEPDPEPEPEPDPEPEPEPDPEPEPEPEPDDDDDGGGGGGEDDGA